MLECLWLVYIIFLESHNQEINKVTKNLWCRKEEVRHQGYSIVDKEKEKWKEGEFGDPTLEAVRSYLNFLKIHDGSVENMRNKPKTDKDDTSTLIDNGIKSPEHLLHQKRDK